MSFDLCICDTCKSIRKPKLIDLLRRTDVYVRKSWVVPLQWLCECRILVAACAQRRCCRSMYMSKDCVVSLQCMWLRCMYIDLIKRKIDRFTASCKHVNAQKLSRVFAMTVWMSYISCSACAKTLLSFCVYEQRLCHVFAVYVIMMHVHWSDKAKNRLIYCIRHKRVDVQKLSRASTMYVCVTCMSCSACAKTLLSFCVYEQRLCCVFAMYVIAMHVHWSDKAKNRSIYCITQTCRCAKAESCLCNICVYVVYELKVWIKRCYCSVCDYAACKSTWKCEKSIDLLHHVCLYVRKSWVVPSQYICICRILAAAKTLLSFCVCASFNALMIAMSLLRFLTVCELNMWVKCCYCSVDVDEIVQLFWQA